MKRPKDFEGRFEKSAAGRGKMYAAADGKAFPLNQGDTVPQNGTSFLNNLSAIQNRIRTLTQSEAEPREDLTKGRLLIVELLNVMLAGEIACVQRFRQHAYFSPPQAAVRHEQFRRLADEHMSRASRLSERIAQLGGSATIDSHVLAVSSGVRTAADELKGLALDDDLTAARLILETYRDIQQWISNGDVRTSRLLDELAGAQVMREAELGILARLVESELTRPPQ